MFQLLKIVAVSAVLSAGFVLMSKMRVDAAATGGKVYIDRLPQGDAAPAQPSRLIHLAGGQIDAPTAGAAAGKGDSMRAVPLACTAQAWPHVSRDCLIAADGTPARASVRTITMERREGNTSVLVRVPAPELAQR
jgi:hypothetical protein